MTQTMAVFVGLIAMVLTILAVGIYGIKWFHRNEDEKFGKVDNMPTEETLREINREDSKKAMQGRRELD